MASSLALQLAGLKSANSAVVDRKKRQKSHAVSLIFEGKVAATQDYETIYAIGLDGLRELELIDSGFEVFENSLFSETSVSYDRLVETEENNKHLDSAIENFLSLLSSKLMLQPALKVLEWLVRRFKIHEHNAELLILSGLPYHEKPIFLKLINIIPTPLPKPFSFLANSKSLLKSPSRHLIIRALANYNNNGFFNLFSNYINKQFNLKRDFPDLITFWSTVYCSAIVFLKQNTNTSDEIISNLFLSSISTPLTLKKNHNAQISSFMIASVLAFQVQLSTVTSDSLSETILRSLTKLTFKSGLSTVATITQLRPVTESLSDTLLESLLRIKNVFDELILINIKLKADKLIIYLLKYVLLNNININNYIPAIKKILFNSNFDSSQKSNVLNSLVIYCLANQLDSSLIKSSLAEIFISISESDVFSPIFSQLLSNNNSNIEAFELLLQTSLKAVDKDTMDLDINITTSKNEDSSSMILNFEESKNKLLKDLKELSFNNIKIDSFLTVQYDSEYNTLLDLFSNCITFKIDLNIFFSLTCFDEINIPTFLIRTWTGGYGALLESSSIQYLLSYLNNASSSIDFQGLIPSVLLALTLSTEKTRRLAAQVISLLNTRNKNKFDKVWALDTIYGTDSKSIKWLKTEDVKWVLSNVIIPNLEEIILDSTFISNILKENLSVVHLSSKSKEYHTKSSIYISLCSHIISSSIFRIKYGLLKVINNLNSVPISKIKILSSLIENMLADSNYPERSEVERFSKVEFRNELVSLVSSSDKKEGYKILESCLNSSDVNLFNAAGDKIKKLWKDFKNETKLLIIRTLIDLTLEENNNLDSSAILNELIIPVEVFEEILTDCKLEPQSTPSSKRRRRSSSSKLLKSGAFTQIAERHIKRLTLVLELLDKSNSSQFNQLLPKLFLLLGETLSMSHEMKISTYYIEQLLADCMLKIVKEISSSSKKQSLDSSVIRIDMIVSCIRSSDSPQVQNKMLLLISSLATIAPELVLHSVMPIFTFMGTNTLRQDDEFSAYVIEKAIFNIIPAIVKASNSTEPDYILLSFVAAFSHIPKHRRLRLFLALVKSLGQVYSCAKLLILLGQKYSDNIYRHKGTEARNISEFVVDFINSLNNIDILNTANFYLKLISEIPNELNEDNEDKFKSYILDVSKYSSENSLLKMKTELLNFFCIAISDKVYIHEKLFPLYANVSSSDDEVLQISANLVSTVLFLLEKSSDESYRESVYNTLETVFAFFPIGRSLSILQGLIKNTDYKVKERSLILIRNQLEANTDAISEEEVVGLLNMLSESLKSSSREPEAMQLIYSTLTILGSKYADSYVTEFLGSLESALEEIIRNSSIDVQISAMVYCASLSSIFGARVVGLLPKIASVCFDSIKGLFTKDGSKNFLVGATALSFFEVLITRIPGLVASYVPTLLGYLLRGSALIETESYKEDDDEEKEDLLELESSYNSVQDVIIEHLPLIKIVESLKKCWKVASDNGIVAIERFLDIFSNSIQYADKKQVGGNANEITTLVIDVFELRNKLHESFGKEELDLCESRACNIALKYVLKLNDKVFSPQFRRLVSWASHSGLSYSYFRLYTFFRFYNKLQSTLKSIVTFYYSNVLDDVLEVLKDFNVLKNNEDDNNSKIDGDFDTLNLRSEIIKSLELSFKYDKDDFWQLSSRFDSILEVLLLQIGKVHDSTVLEEAFGELALCCRSEENHKAINAGLVEKMKSDNSKEKIGAIKAMGEIYSKVGEEWLVLLPQLVPIVSELLEDDDDDVEAQVRKELVPVIESVLGESLDKYLN